MKTNKFIILISLILSLSSCSLLFYSSKDISISPDVKTYFVQNFQNNAFNSPATINIDFSEQLRDKIRKETSLTYAEIDPDITFSGFIASYDVSSQAPASDGSSINRLQISIQVSFNNVKHENENWENQKFSYYSDFSADKSLNDVQDELISEIFDHILDDIINKAFNNW
ncbi:MAG: LptE family protein [Saprospiraceae bacterium]